MDNTFGFATGDRARRLEEMDRNPPPAPVGVTIRRVPRSRSWEVIDERGRVLALWATRERAERDAGRYRRAER